MKLVTLLFIFAISIFSSTSNAGTIYEVMSDTDGVIECYNCQSTTENIFVNVWAWHHFTDQESASGVSKELTIIDLYNTSTKTFSIVMEADPSRQTDDGSIWYQPRKTLVSTPTFIQSKMQSVTTALEDFNDEASDLEIPESIVDDAWRFVNCAYCKNDINDFVNSRLSGKKLVVEGTIISIAQAFNLINTAVPNEFILPLAVGGHIKVKLTITAQPIQLDVEIVEVVDKHNNTISTSASNLKGQNIRIVDMNQARFIQNILNNFHLKIPLKIGIVTITCEDNTFVC